MNVDCSYQHCGRSFGLCNYHSINSLCMSYVVVAVEDEKGDDNGVSWSGAKFEE